MIEAAEETTVTLEDFFGKHFSGQTEAVVAKKIEGVIKGRGN